MEVVLGTFNLALRGGSETYALTVAAALQRLGHGVTVFTGNPGELAEEAREAGIRVASHERELPDACDVVLAQDGTSAYLLARRFPSAPQVFRAPSPLFDFQLPPQLPGACHAIVVLNDRLGGLVGALAHRPRIVRLRQPVDVERFVPLGPLPERPCRVLLLGNYLSGPRRRLLLDACARLGLECTALGAGSGSTPDPLAALGEADVVVGKGRVILEAMACGRAAFVYDLYGYDGWVTPETYPELEARGFDGLARDRSYGLEELTRDLAAYRPEMGPANRDLAVAHHNARRHAEELVSLFRSLPVAERTAAPLEELARLVRAVWEAERRAHGLARSVETLHERIGALEAALGDSELRLRAAEERAGAADAFEHGAAAVRAGRRYRAGATLALPLDAVRALRRRNGSK